MKKSLSSTLSTRFRLAFQRKRAFVKLIDMYEHEPAGHIKAEILKES